MTDIHHIWDPIHKAINKYRNHPNIVNIGENIPNHTNQHFQGNIDICLHILTKLINCSIINSKLPIDLGMADVSLPVIKKGDACNKENYRPVSLLPTVSKIYENRFRTQINDYIENYFSDYLCLLGMFENMKRH